MEKIWRRFNKRIIGTNDQGCWLMSGSHDKGYSWFRITGMPKQKGHRASWILHYGEVPDDFHVLHKCDVRNCVNPDHLFLGTNQDNIEDKVRKGRQGRRGPVKKFFCP